MKLSIIIPTYNRRENIERTLSCLQNQVIQSQHEVAVIVVDDGSDDGTKELLVHWQTLPNFTLIRKQRKHVWNVSIPRNSGARIADIDTDLYYFLDSDVMLTSDRIQRLIDDWLADPDPSRVIIGPYHYMQKELSVAQLNETITDYQQDVRWQSFLDHPVEQKNTGISFALACFGGSLAVPRDLFFKAGCYNEKLGAGVEDGEFGLRLARAGAVFSLDKGLLGWHHPHEVLPARTEGITEYVKIINMDHFGSENPDYGLIEASKETYKQWQIDWVVPQVWSN